MIGAIENRILARLREASEAGLLGYRYRTLETYPEDWDAYLKEKGPIVAPAAWVTFAGWGQPEQSNPLRATGQFGLVVMAENARNETATRHGGPVAGEPGSYQLIEDAVALLAGQDLGLEIGGIEIGSLRFVRKLEALNERKVSMLALELRTRFVPTTPLLPDDGIGDFTTFHANWDVPAFAELGPLPADDRADATDHVTLETAE